MTLEVANIKQSTKSPVQVLIIARFLEKKSEIELILYFA